MEKQRTYIAIDLKSFYASVECVERGLDPLKANLVVADPSRTDKTICLAVSPSLKAYGIPGRPRLFEVVQRVREVNRQNPGLNLDYIVAPPRMAHYMKVSTQVYQTYLRYVRPEEIHVYSIDEVFIDVTDYLPTYRLTAHELAIKMIRDVLKTTGITATAGIGTNLYLAKVAMDIVAKHMPADADGVRIAELDEQGYRRQLWGHRPLTAFWRVGHGTANRLATLGIETMGQLARASLAMPDRLYALFGVNAELLIDHAWGYEPCTIDLIKRYRPGSNSLSFGQVLTGPFTFRQARVTVEEMADGAALDLVEKRMVADQMVLSVGYDTECLTRPGIADYYRGEVVLDHFGRRVPRPAHGSVNLPMPTSSSAIITRAVTELYDRIVDPALLVRRIYLSANHVVDEAKAAQRQARQGEQLDLFTDYEARREQERALQEALDKERRLQEARLAIKQRFGKNAILKGLNFEDGGTAIERNRQIGGHKA